MKLYTLQSIETMYMLHKDTCYFMPFGIIPPSLGSNWTKLGQTLILKYNEIKKQEFSCLPIQWYLKPVALGHFNADNTGAVLIQAEIPIDMLLLPEMITPYLDLTWILKRESCLTTSLVEM